MEFTQHVPNSCDIGDQKPIRIKGTIQEILNHEWVNKWTKLSDFYRFSVSRVSDNLGHLMMESDEGYKWWVVGRLSEIPKELPVWEARYKTEQEVIDDTPKGKLIDRLWAQGRD